MKIDFTEQLPNIGDEFNTRNGLIATVVKIDSEDETLPVLVTYSDNSCRDWIYTDGSVARGEEDPYDLVSPVQKDLRLGEMTYAEVMELKHAAAAGKAIEMRSDYGDWGDIYDPNFDALNAYYRLKPEPEPEPEPVSVTIFGTGLPDGIYRSDDGAQIKVYSIG